MSEWKKIRTQEDIDFLKNEYCGFHDSCIVSAHFETGSHVDENGTMKDGDECDKVLCVSFDSQAVKKKLELRFWGVRNFGFVGWQKDCFCDINGCYLNIDSDLIIWSDSELFSPGMSVSITKSDYSYVVSSSLEYKLK